MLLSSLKSWSLAALTFRLAASRSTRKNPGAGSHSEFLPFATFCSQASVPLCLHPGAPSWGLKRDWEGVRVNSGTGQSCQASLVTRKK